MLQLSEKGIVFAVERFEACEGLLGFRNEMLVATVLDQIIAEDGASKCQSAHTEENHKEKEVKDALALHGPQSKWRQA